MGRLSRPSRGAGRRGGRPRLAGPPAPSARRPGRGPGRPTPSRTVGTRSASGATNTPPTGQPLAEQFPPAGQPVRHRARRAAEPAGGVLVRQPFQVAQDERRPVLLRAAGRLPRRGRPELVPRGAPIGAGRPAREARRLCGEGGRRAAGGPGLDGGPVGDPVEPVARAGPAGRWSAAFADQDEEGGLERVLGVVGVAEDAAADAQHHRPVPADERGERGLVAGVEEPAEQFGVGRTGAVGGGSGAGGRIGSRFPLAMPSSSL